MKLHRRLLGGALTLLLLSLAAGCGGGGGSLAPGGSARVGPQPEQVNLALRVRVAPPGDRGIRAQGGDLSNVSRLTFDVLDTQSLLRVVPTVTLNLPLEEGQQVVEIEGVPVGFRILRVQGFAETPPQENGIDLPEPGFSQDFPLNVAFDASFNDIDVNVSPVGIQGEGGVIPFPGGGNAGDVEPIGGAPAAGVSERQPDITIAGLSYGITYRRDTSADDGVIVADVFSGDSLDYTRQPQDVDGSTQGFVVSGGGGNRSFPSIAMDQLLNFSVVWEDNLSRTINGRSYSADITPLGPEVADLTRVAIDERPGRDPAISNAAQVRPFLNSTINPDPPVGPGGELRHLAYLDLLEGSNLLGVKVFPPEDPNCAHSELTEDPCKQFFDKAHEFIPASDTSIGLATASDGLFDILVWHDGSDFHYSLSSTAPGVVGEPGLVSTLGSGAPGGCSTAFLVFNFGLGTDNWVVAYEKGGEIFVRAYQFNLGEILEIAGPLKIADGTSPSVAAATSSHFYLSYLDPQGQVVLDLFHYNNLARVSANAPHLVSEGSGNSSPKVAASSFGAVVVWEGDKPNGTRGVFHKRFSTGFQP